MNDWNIRKCSPQCEATGHRFEDGEEFYTLLFRESGEWRRVDLCQSAWAERNDNIKPFSFWKTAFVAPPPAEPETVPRENAESLLRKLIEDDDPAHARTRYILALMLERKKTLKHTDTKQTESGPLMIYEHGKTGEVFLVPDPQLRLDQIESVQEEVGGMLGGEHQRDAKTQTPEAQTPEAQTPEAQTPEAQTPEAQTPEAQTPEAQTPEAQAEEAQAEQARAEEARAVSEASSERR